MKILKKFIQLLRKELKLLSVKKIIWLIAAASLIALVSCGKEESKEPVDNLLDDSASVYSLAESVIGEAAAFASKGNFNTDTLDEIAAGVEIVEGDTWGLKFYLLNKVDDGYKIAYQSDVMEGSFEDALTRNIKFPNYEYELLYYNSQKYFLGSGGGEIFSYIIDFEKKQIYYAHFVSIPRKRNGLYLSSNIKDESLRSFFISNFKRDFPDLTLMTEDISLEF